MINDTLGYTAGDALLPHFASVCHQAFAILIRYPLRDDEFAIILDDVNEPMLYQKSQNESSKHVPSFTIADQELYANSEYRYQHFPSDAKDIRVAEKC
jgi:GGDEF domain-containing protein